MSKQALKQLLSQGATRQVIEKLLQLDKGNDFHNEVVKVSARWQTLQTEIISGVTTETAQRLARNQIHDALLRLIDVSEGGTAPPRLEVGRKRTSAPVYLILLGLVIPGMLYWYFGGGDATPPGSSGRTLTVLVHGPDGRDDLVLPGRGIVYLIYGDAKIPEEINSEGEATFKQIDAAFFDADASVSLLFQDPLGEPYRVRRPDSLYRLRAGQSVALEVGLMGMDKLEGTVRDFATGTPIDSAELRIRGSSYYTNEYGEFTLDIPQDRRAQFIDISISKPGYVRKELTNVPTTTDRPQLISLKAE